MSHFGQLALEMKQTRHTMGLMKISRAAILILIALFTTAIWGVILIYGSRALGAPIGAGSLAAILAVICVVVLLALSMAALASDSGGEDDGPQPPSAP